MDVGSATKNLSCLKEKVPYKIIYEVFDSCHNVGYDSCYLLVKDLVKPVPVVEKGLTVNLTDKKVWLDAEAFDEGSKDNCGLQYLFVRRADWYEFCLDLCDSLIPVCTPNDHDTLFLPYLNPDKRIDEVEAHYARQLAWLRNEGETCHELLYNAWQYDLMKHAAKQCRTHPYEINEMRMQEWITECLDQDALLNVFRAGSHSFAGFQLLSPR